MACEVCEHCNSPVRPGEGTIRDGFSYHDRCNKCYVCSETNLHNAEVFKGVIFCSGCSRRIFKGCSTARKVKTGNKRRRGRTRYRQGHENRVIELARLNSLVSDSNSGTSKLSKQPSDVTKILKESRVEIKEDSLKKASVDMATTTDVTQELLQNIYSPVDSNEKMFASPAKPRKKCKNEVVQSKKNMDSDIRIAANVGSIHWVDVCGDSVSELGASREMAHVALRRRSEVPVIIQSESYLRHMRSKNRSYMAQESDTSGDTKYSKGNVNKHWLDRRFRSIMKLPYKIFKKNILNRSSLVNTLSSDDKECIARRFKILFRYDITEHQCRGLKRLFSTINSKKIPYRLGWLEIMTEIPENSGYRCMRNQVMKSAGPTRSELAEFRRKLKNFIFFDFLKDLHNFNKQFLYMLTSQACKQESIAYTQ
ncbi:uncharacterized protein LOC126778879 isoform X2 [Nymphalis io]|uniref:uncharacterized protein LOC126778879 isoform X2 n=1 Tax=Inachis io TaxID=171585 RepID=UPI0021676630|nr:uncharacterized protein LOC126778879 isoform X2 [Nymphalis io]